MQTLEEFKKWYKDNHKYEEVVEYFADEYLYGLDYPPYATPNGSVKIGGKSIPIGDVSEIVDEWFVGNYIEQSDLVDDCTHWLINYIKSIDEGEVMKCVKVKMINKKKIELEGDFTNV